MLDDVDEGLESDQASLGVELVLHCFDQVVGEELGIGNQGIRQHHGEGFDEFEEEQFQAFVIIAIGKIIEKQLEQAIHLVFNDRRG